MLITIVLSKEFFLMANLTSKLGSGPKLAYIVRSNYDESISNLDGACSLLLPSLWVL